MAPVIPDPARIRAFADAAEFEAWVREHHAAEPELWLRIYKKGSGVATVTYAEALEVALCWGWIDGIRKSFDAASFIQRFTPRGRKSIWSQVNREHVARLTEAGRMTEHGRRHVDAAKADGRWDRAYAPASTMTVPDDLMTAIEADPAAAATFRRLDATNRFALAFRLQSLRTAAGREKKIASFVALLARGETLLPMRKAAADEEPKT